MITVFPASVGTTVSVGELDFDPATQAELNDVDTRLLAVESGVVPVTPVTDSYTLALADAGKIIEMNAATAETVTIPPDDDVAFLVDSCVGVERYGAGTVTIVAGAGVTVRSAGGLAIGSQYGAVSLRKRATNEWVLVGDLA